jgi:NADH:ubiquinone oxidoreductase subunit 6 (subunit J)
MLIVALVLLLKARSFLWVCLVHHYPVAIMILSQNFVSSLSHKLKEGAMEVFG